MAGYEQLSLARMEDTVLADRFDLRDKIEKLRGKKIRFTKVDLSMRFQASGEELDAIVEDLREVGLLRLLEDDLIIPPLYRPALTIGVQGRELEINLDDANADVTTAVEQLADDDWATESSGSMTSDAKVHRARKRKNKRERYRDTTVDQIQISETDEEDDVHDKLERELTSDITPAPRKSERLEVEMSYAQSLANNGDVRAAFDHIFPQYAHSSHALLLACNFAVRIDDGALVDAVVAEATKPHWRNLSALMGRIFGLALLESDWEVASEVCAYLKGRQIDRAIFGLISMLDGLQEREWEVYSKWALLAGNSDPAPRSRSMEAVASVIAASRVLALARDSNESTHSSSIARWLNRYWVDFSGRNVSRTLHNFLGEYVRLKDTNFPSLFPYQILSIAEVLNHTRSLPQSLGDDVVLALVDVARSMSATDFDAFAAWRPYSTLADQVTIQIEIIRDAPPSR
jgi:hypothetical protein